MPFCTYCGQSFTRDEHLERHILTHTNVKPYKCFTCHMSFARRDLLHRHYTVHGRDENQEPLPASDGIVPKSAGRTPIACSNCAKTKTKCDKKFPCSRCASRNLKCTVRPTRRTAKTAARMTGVVEAGHSSDGTLCNSSNASATSSPPAEDASNALKIHMKSASASPVRTHALPHSMMQTPAMPHHSATPPTQSFMQHTPLSGYDDFSGRGLSRNGSDHAISPPMMQDWSHIPMHAGYEGMRPDMLPMTFNPSAMHMGAMPNEHTHPHMMQDYSHAMPQLPSPASEHEIAVMHMAKQHNGMYMHPYQAHMTSGYPGMMPGSDLEAYTLTQDAWSAFRCNPIMPSSACPRTAKLNLERLELTLRNHEIWGNWRPSWDESDFALGDYLAITPIHEMVRDKLLAITQSFLHKALEIHSEDQSQMMTPSHSPNGYNSNFVILPPARVLEYFLRSYANSFERYYPMTAKGTLNANEIMHGYNDKASSLLVLLMIAQGAMTTPSVESRWLTGGLIEACRISLFNLIEKNIMLSGDAMVLHSALLFTTSAAWSGDKWQQDIAMGQRGMYFAMLRHSGILEHQAIVPNMAPCPSPVDQLWNAWIQQEGRSRLIYSWAMVDQELSLFHDTAPLFSVPEFGAPMPDSDGLWHARSAAEWSSIFEQVHEFSGGYSSVGSGARPLSLRDLFRHFLDDTILAQGIELTALHLRLLLHPLQSLVFQYRQLLTCFTDTPTSAPTSSDATTAAAAAPTTVTATATLARLAEARALLARWHSLATRYLAANPPCPLMQSTMLTYHLLALNALADFPAVERLARHEGVDGSYAQLAWLHARALPDRPAALAHAGQVLRSVRAMPRSIRPPWWAAAVYRAALVLWADGLVGAEVRSPVSSTSATASGAAAAVGGEAAAFAVDGLPVEHAAVARYMATGEGVPMLTKSDGSQMPVDNAFAVLFHCVDVIAEGVSTRFSDGIRSKLERLAKSWS